MAAELFPSVLLLRLKNISVLIPLKQDFASKF